MDRPRSALARPLTPELLRHNVEWIEPAIYLWWALLYADLPAAVYVDLMNTMAETGEEKFILRPWRRDPSFFILRLQPREPTRLYRIHIEAFLADMEPFLLEDPRLYQVPLPETGKTLSRTVETPDLPEPGVTAFLAFLRDYFGPEHTEDALQHSKNWRDVLRYLQVVEYGEFVVDESSADFTPEEFAYQRREAGLLAWHDMHTIRPSTS